MVEHSHCICCGKPLKKPKSRRRGYGPDCARKMAGHEQMDLFDFVEYPDANSGTNEHETQEPATD